MGASITPENLTVRYATPPNSEPNLTTINRLVLIRARRYRVAVRMLTHVRRWGLEVAIDAVERTRARLVRYGGFDRLATNDAL